MRELWDGSDPYIKSWEMAYKMPGMSYGTPTPVHMRVKVFQDKVISIDGVESVWRWECPHNGCRLLRVHSSYATFWETALRGAIHHVKWHRSFNAKI